MDVVSDKKVDRLVATYGMTRIYELDDKTWLTAQDGTASWRNNNPGNLKLEFAGSEQYWTPHAAARPDDAMVESFNGRQRQECPNEHWLLSLAHARSKISEWRTFYNEDRPRTALSWKTLPNSPVNAGPK